MCSNINTASINKLTFKTFTSELTFCKLIKEHSKCCIHQPHTDQGELLHSANLTLRAVGPSALAFSITDVGIWKERSKTKHTSQLHFTAHWNNYKVGERMCKSREQLLSPGAPHTAPAFPFTSYCHNYTMAHGDLDSKETGKRKV